MDKIEIWGKIYVLENKIRKLSQEGRENGRAYQIALATQDYLYRKLREIEEQDSNRTDKNQ